jgi:hypothetical protein
LTTLLNSAEKSCGALLDCAAAIMAAASAAAEDEFGDGETGAIEFEGDADCCWFGGGIGGQK